MWVEKYFCFVYKLQILREYRDIDMFSLSLYRNTFSFNRKGNAICVFQPFLHCFYKFSFVAQFFLLHR